MQLKELEKLKAQYPQLVEVLSKYDNYLRELSKKTTNPDIVPVMVARRLSVTEARATALLSWLSDEGLLQPSYLVYCAKNDYFLNQYTNIRDIPQEIDCPIDNEKHDIDDCNIQLIFQFTDLFHKRYPAFATV